MRMLLFIFSLWFSWKAQQIFNSLIQKYTFLKLHKETVLSHLEYLQKYKNINISVLLKLLVSKN